MKNTTKLYQNAGAQPGLVEQVFELQEIFLQLQQPWFSEILTRTIQYLII